MFSYYTCYRHLVNDVKLTNYCAAYSLALLVLPAPKPILFLHYGWLAH